MLLNCWQLHKWHKWHKWQLWCAVSEHRNVNTHTRIVYLPDYNAFRCFLCLQVSNHAMFTEVRQDREYAYGQQMMSQCLGMKWSLPSTVTVLLYYCTLKLLYCCTIVLLYSWTIVLRYSCTIVLLYYYTLVLLYSYTIVLLYYCNIVPARSIL